MANELAKKNSFSNDLMVSLDNVNQALPTGFNKTRFIQNAIALLNDNKQLSDFAKQHGTSQIKAGLLKGAILGLDAMNSEFYLVGYGSNLQFMPSYKGAAKTCKKYSVRPIKDIYAKLVREGDEFEETIVNGEQSVNFKPLPFNDGKIVGAFAVCLFKDGGVLVDTMSVADIENSRKSSKMANGPTWKNFYGEMAKKTVLHRLCKHIELDFDSPEQFTYFNEDMQIASTEEQVATEIEENSLQEEFIDMEEE